MTSISVLILDSISPVSTIQAPRTRRLCRGSVGRMVRSPLGVPYRAEFRVFPVLGLPGTHGLQQAEQKDQNWI